MGRSVLNHEQRNNGKDMEQNFMKSTGPLRVEITYTTKFILPEGTIVIVTGGANMKVEHQRRQEEGTHQADGFPETGRSS
jgi:hypothetical protein